MRKRQRKKKSLLALKAARNIPLTLHHYYCWDGKKITTCHLFDWAMERHSPRLRSKKQRYFWQVARTQIGEVRVSTVFTGLDHNYPGNGPPVLFETMVFGGGKDGYQRHYSGQMDAEVGHLKTVAWIRELEAA